jgi:hypothetical protein
VNDTPARPRRRRRPFGVTMIAWLLIINMLSIGTTLLLEDSPFGIEIDNDFVEGSITLALLVIAIVIAVGLWRLRRWAWIATMIWFGVSMATALAAWRDGHAPYTSMVLDVITVFYLNQRDVQAAFRHRREPEPETVPV